MLKFSRYQQSPIVQQMFNFFYVFTLATDNDKIKPAVMLTNDFELPLESVVRKYARRWLVEKGIAQQIDFFHLNRLSSSMVIKVDFDLVMSILAHNIYRLLAMSLDRYQQLSDERTFEKFVDNSMVYPWLQNKVLNFSPSASS